MSKWKPREVTEETSLGVCHCGKELYADGLPVWAFNQLKAGYALIEAAEAVYEAHYDDRLGARQIKNLRAAIDAVKGT